MSQFKLEQFILGHVCHALGIRIHELPIEHANLALKLFRIMDKKTFAGYDMQDIGPAIGNVLADQIKQKFGTRQQFDLKELQTKMLESDTYTVNASAVDGGAGGMDGMGVNGSFSDSGLDGTGGMGGMDGTGGLSGAGDKQPTAINVVDFLGIKSADAFKMFINPESLYQHFYLVLDSNYRNTTAEVSSQIKRFTWNYAPTQNTGTGYCNSVGVIRDVIGMRMYQPRIPYLAAMNTSSKRVSVLIEEFAPQAFIDSNGRRYHFLLRPNFVTGQTDIELSTEDYNDGIFNFRKPITTFSTVSLSFGDPSNVLTFSTPFNRFIIPFEFICLKSNK